MKLRLIIKTKDTTNIILRKHIEYVVINNVKYSKPDYKTSIAIYKFYNLIGKDLSNITELKLNNGTIYRLKNGILHSCLTYAIEKGVFKYYYINGILLDKEKWILYSRKYKIENILNKKAFQI